MTQILYAHMNKRNNFKKEQTKLDEQCPVVKEKTKMLETILGKIKFIKEVEIIWGQKILGGNLHWPWEVLFCFLVCFCTGMKPSASFPLVKCFPTEHPEPLEGGLHS
jgi:hypothetical protein